MIAADCDFRYENMGPVTIWTPTTPRGVVYVASIPSDFGSLPGTVAVRSSRNASIEEGLRIAGLNCAEYDPGLDAGGDVRGG